MLNLLGPRKYVVYLLVLASLVGGAVLAVRRYNDRLQEIGYDRRSTEQLKIDSTNATKQRMREISLQKEKDDAVTQGLEDSRKAVVDRDAALAAKRVSDVALREQRARLLTATLAAARNYAASCNSILAECQDRYRAVAEDAQRFSNDSLMLQRAWPRK